MRMRSIAATLSTVMMLATSPGWADDPQLDSELAKIKQECDGLAKKRDEIKRDLTERVSIISSYIEGSDRATAPTSASRRKTAVALDALDSLVTQTQQLIQQSHPQTDSEKRELIRLLSNAVDYSKLVIGPINHDLRVDLDDLRVRAAISTEAASRTNAAEARELSDRAWGTTQKFGGVFINETAVIPGLQGEIGRAEYDPDASRFVLYGTGRRWFVPADKDLAAVVLRCLYDGGERNQIATSFNIDPVTMRFPEHYVIGRGVRNGLAAGAFNASPAGYHMKVMLGCEFAEHTRVGRIRINSDDLVDSLAKGINHKGELLTKKLGYVSQLQLTLDHPVTRDIFEENPDSQYDLAPCLGALQSQPPPSP
jgi:hypothetical protein